MSKISDIIKKFKSVSKFLKKNSSCFYPNGLEKVSINNDFTISTIGTVSFTFRSFAKLPLSFKNVEENFIICLCNELKTLKGVPEKVGQDFKVVGCDKLKNFDYFPKEVGGDVYINEHLIDNENNLKILEKTKINGYIRLMKSEGVSSQGKKIKIVNGVIEDHGEYNKK